MPLWLRAKACAVGVSEYCPQVAQVDPPSPQWKRQVKVTAYTSRKQENDSTPCEGAFGNVCNAFSEGFQPVAVSRDLLAHLGKGDAVKFKVMSGNGNCRAYENKEMVVLDTLSECTRKNRDLRTNRCIKKIENQIDIFIPCDGVEGDWDYCMESVAKAGAIGSSCVVELTKL